MDTAQKAKIVSATITSIKVKPRADCLHAAFGFMVSQRSCLLQTTTLVFIAVTGLFISDLIDAVTGNDQGIVLIALHTELDPKRCRLAAGEQHELGHPPLLLTQLVILLDGQLGGLLFTVKLHQNPVREVAWAHEI